MIQQMGIVLPPGANLQSKNVAAVMLNAQLPAFASSGQQIDVTVSAIGNAKSLRGGTLILSPLKAVNGQVYALAQGPLVLGTVPGKGLKAHENVARVPAGAIVERDAPGFENQKQLTVVLHKSSWETVDAVAKQIQSTIGVTARPLDSRKIEVLVSDTMPVTTLAARLSALPVAVAQREAKIVINARTGSIVLGQGIQVGECAIAHGNISINIGAAPVAGQEPPKGTVALMEKQTTLAEVVKTLNTLGATPQDIISIVQAMKDAGALNAQIEVI